VAAGEYAGISGELPPAGDRRDDGRHRDRSRITAETRTALLLHEGELVAQHGDAPRRQRLGDGDRGRMIDTRAGAVPEDEQRRLADGSIETRRDLEVVADGERGRLQFTRLSYPFQ
jgi:hypothetical protein